MNQPEKDLNRLLQQLSPELNEGRYVFCPVPREFEWSGLPNIGSFLEREGTTLILEQGVADRHGLAYDLVLGWITITVHSALDALGLTAAFSKALADAQISCNVVAGYYHDHLFVPEKDCLRAVRVLRELQKTAGG